MKQIRASFLIACISIAFGTQLAGADDPEKSPNGVNGRWWRKQSDSLKLGFVIGYAHAAGFVAFIATVGPAPDKFVRVAKETWPNNLTFGEVEDSLDRFYAVPENGPVSVACAIELIADRAEGRSEADIQERLLKMRTGC